MKTKTTNKYNNNWENVMQLLKLYYVLLKHVHHHIQHHISVHAAAP